MLVSTFIRSRLVMLSIVLIISCAIIVMTQVRYEHGNLPGGAGQLRFALLVSCLNIGLSSSGITAGVRQDTASVRVEFLAASAISGGCLALGILRALWDDMVMGSAFFALFAIGSAYSLTVLVKAANRHSEGKRSWSRPVHELEEGRIQLQQQDVENSGESLSTSQ